MILCDVYRSSKKPDVYLYVNKSEGLARVPDDLLATFGNPEHSFLFKLTADRKLAKEDAAKVLKNLEEQGYHLQLPPSVTSYAGTASRGRVS
jgi:uncharacterized protein YcgL (UPF0745 family)